MVSNLHKETKKVFSEVISDLYNMTSHGKKTPMISEFHYNVIMKNADRLNSAIIYDRDFTYQYFGIKTLERSYLLKIGNYETFLLSEQNTCIITYEFQMARLPNVLSTC